jgi:CRISPR-associated protein (TIGR02710 family)
LQEVKNLFIYTVGGTPEPIIRSILTYKPEVCYFICSRETEPLVAKILEEAHARDPSFTTTSHIERVKNHEDIIECYRTSHQILMDARRKYPNHRISIDFTGGTKSMSAGLVLAATKFGNFTAGKGAYATEPFKYIGGEVRDRYGRVVTGHERPLDRRNPLQEFLIEDVEEAISLFNNYHFEAAEIIFNKCYSKLGDPRFKLMERASQGFKYWDKFMYEKALEVFNQMDLLIQDISKFELLPDTFLKIWEERKRILRKLSLWVPGRTGRRGKPNPEHDPNMEALDMICNAERRIEMERYDDALIRCYRAIEMAVSATLKKEYKIRMEKIDWNEFERLYPGKKEILLQRLGRLPESLWLGDEELCVILEVLGSPLVNVLRDKKFDVDNLRIRRNRLLLVHGFQTVTKDIANGSLKLCKEFIANWMQLNLEQIDEKLAYLRFPKLSPEYLIL